MIVPSSDKEYIKMNWAILEGVGWDSSVTIKTEGRYPLRLLGFDIDIEAKLQKLMYFWKTLFLISLSLTQIEQILHQRLKTHEDSHQSLRTRTHQPLDLAAIMNPNVIGSTWRPYATNLHSLGNLEKLTRILSVIYPIIIKLNAVMERPCLISQLI